jgi:glutamate dehydrogenase (NADP+)
VTNDPAVTAEVEHFMQGLIRRNPGMPEFHQAVREVVDSLMPFVRENPAYREAQILERMTEPDRVVIFRVAWEDDEGNVRVNRAWRCSSTARSARTRVGCGSTRR